MKRRKLAAISEVQRNGLRPMCGRADASGAQGGGHKRCVADGGRHMLLVWQWPPTFTPKVKAIVKATRKQHKAKVGAILTGSRLELRHFSRSPSDPQASLTLAADGLTSD